MENIKDLPKSNVKISPILVAEFRKNKQTAFVPISATDLIWKEAMEKVEDDNAKRKMEWRGFQAFDKRGCNQTTR